MRYRLLENTEVWVVSPEDLILSKLEWSRETASTTQRNDIQVVLRNNPNLNFKYLDQWAETIGVGKTWTLLKHEAA